MNRSCLCSILITTALICGAYFIGNAYIDKEFKERLLRWKITDKMHNATSNTCQNLNKPLGSEALPQGIIVKTSNLETQHLWNYCDSENVTEGNTNRSMSLLAMAVGIKQNELVNKVIQKFPLQDFVVMLFHYDGVWTTGTSIHGVHMQFMFPWFAKRFLHPDVVAEYEYIFLWDEDLGVGHFNPQR
ncbi:unnamed protein product [Brassica oleracea var. botrytis]